jgi:hypothetical protein
MPTSMVRAEYVPAVRVAALWGVDRRQVPVIALRASVRVKSLPGQPARYNLTDCKRVAKDSIRRAGS